MKNSKLKLLFYTLGFFLALQTALPAYINSSFIEQRFFSENLVGFLYVIGALFTIISLLKMPWLLKKIGNFNTTLVIIATITIILSILAFSQNTSLILLSFILYLTLSTTISFNLDIFLEHHSNDNNTGKIRGSYLTLINLAWLFSPLLVSFVLSNGDYWKIYLISALISLPFIFLLFLGVKNFKDPIYNLPPFLRTFKKIKNNENLHKIFVIKFLLHFFYAWMVIYTPLYLHKYIGFDWQIIGIIFTIMLLPFILFQFPLGKLADKKWGEKEMLSCGIVILSLTTIILSFLSIPIFWIWTIILFFTRIGASIIEVASESYFFKQVDSGDANLISFFRIANPLAYSIAPLIAFFILLFLDFCYLFLVLGIIMLFGLKYALTLKDTR